MTPAPGQAPPARWGGPQRGAPLLTTALVLALPGASAAQRVDPQAPLTEVLESRRTTGSPHMARAILSQASGPQTPERLDALADSLVAVVLAYRPGGSQEQLQAARAAIGAITWAGNRLNRTLLYPRAFSRLVQIHQEAEVGFASGALRGIAYLADETVRARAYLREVAVSDSPLAWRAIQLLAEEMGPEGLAIVQALHTSGEVQHGLARSQVALVARRHGWR